MTNGLRRFFALTCLVSAYEAAVTSFDARWLAAILISAVAVATGPSHWATSYAESKELDWPAGSELRRSVVPGWLLMLLAAGGKVVLLSPGLVFGLWLGGAVWLLAGTWRLSRQRLLVATGGSERWVWACGLFVVAVAAGLRLWQIGEVPRYVHSDEGTNNLIAQQLYRSQSLDWLFAPGWHYPMMRLGFFVLGLGTPMFGFNLVGARVSDALLGILSIALVFDGLRRASNLRVATVGALLLAANHCHIAFSRVGSGNIQTAFVVALAFALFSRMWVRPTYFNAALLGIAMALGVQTYQASMLALPLLGASMTWLWLLNPGRRRALRVPLMVFAVTCVTAAAPLGVVFWQQGNQMVERSRQLNILSEHKMIQLKAAYETDSTMAVIGQQAWNSLRGFHSGRDGETHYGIRYPMADPYTAALMVAGGALALLGGRQFVACNALAFTLCYLVFGLGMQSPPGFNRAIGALPLAMVMPAIALVQCWGTLWGGRARITRWARDLSLALVITLCVGANIQIYFTDYQYSRLHGDATSEAGWAAREYARDYSVHMASWPQPGPDGLRLIIGDLPVSFPRENDLVAYAQNAPVNDADLFIISPEHGNVRDALLARFPEARLELWRRDPKRGPMLFLVFVGQPRATPMTPSPG